MTPFTARRFALVVAWCWMAQHAPGAQAPMRGPDSLRPPLACSSDLVADRPGSGTEVGRQQRGGLGSLHITNSSESDAIAVLIDADTRLARRAIYLRRGESGDVSSVPAGRYRVQFQVGETWLKTGRFCRITGTSQFGEVLVFSGREAVDSIGYNRYEVTLYPVVFFGDVDPDALPNLPLALP